MSELKPVSFRKPVRPEPRLSKPYVPGRRDARLWTEEEKDIIRRYYPQGGNAACLAHLGPHRTPSGIYQQARKLGLASPRGTADYKGTSGRIEPPTGFDEAVRRFYCDEYDGKKRGGVNAFADRLGVPRWWVTAYARRHGLVMPHKKEPPWTATEVALLERVPLHDVDRCAKIFREHGFERSPTAIQVKAARLSLSRRYTATFSATAIARILGIDGKSVTREIIQGDLKATKRPTKRLPQQGGDPWSVSRADLRRYIIEKLERIDFRKVDKFELVDVLTRDEGKTRGSGK